MAKTGVGLNLMDCVTILNCNVDYTIHSKMSAQYYVCNKFKNTTPGLVVEPFYKSICQDIKFLVLDMYLWNDLSELDSRHRYN